VSIELSFEPSLEPSIEPPVEPGNRRGRALRAEPARGLMIETKGENA
jgi:hypothetical protein